MVCSVSAIKSAGVAGKYLEQVDDYLSEKGVAATEWYGKGAEGLGLEGPVRGRDATELLHGRLPNGDQLGRAGKDGKTEHKPGWDLTFSAPKSVSVAALVHGDERLIEAHNQAVREALAYIEREAAATRIRTPEGVETVATGNIAAALYRHATSREKEPDLHTHAAVINATRSADGRWRSIESRPIYRVQMQAGEVYRNSLARQARELGYAIEKTRAGDHPSFELKAVSRAERELFSTRSKQIEEALAERGKTRETATAAEKEAAALDTRQGKQEGIDHAELRREWRGQAQEAGAQFKRPDAPEKINGRDAADAAIRHAAEHLAEREARFTEHGLLDEARRHAMGGASEAELRQALDRARASGELLARETRAFNAVTGQREDGLAGFTTRENVKAEAQMLAIAREAVGAAQPITDLERAREAIRAQELATGHSFNPGQRAAAEGILTSRDRIHLVQGFAGTAKTTSVLAATARELERQGYQVVALAPTVSAADTLGRALEREGKTVAAFLNEKPDAGGGKRVVVVDEFSMLSAKDTARLLQATRGDVVVAVGDVKQIGSVEAGAAFRQVQAESGLKTKVLDEIVRQNRNEQLKSAIYDAIKGDAREMLDKMDTRELATREERVAAIAKDYTDLSREDRARTLVIAPGKDDRREINDAIRARLAEQGELRGEAQQLRALEAKDLTRAQAREAGSYEVGDIVRAGRAYQSLGMNAGDQARVVEVDVDRNRITIEKPDGSRAELDPAKYSRLSAYTEHNLEVRQGDKLIARENERFSNGDRLSVIKVDRDAVHVVDPHGEKHILDTRQARALDHAYAETAHQSQGKTVERVLIHAESSRVNLTNQQSAYVSASRATDTARIYTDNKQKLAEQLNRETGQKETALDGRERHQEQPSGEREGKRAGERSEGQEGPEKALTAREREIMTAALATRGQWNDKRIDDDVKVGKAAMEEAGGRRFAVYRNAQGQITKALDKDLHAPESRSTQLRGLAGQREARIVDKHLINARILGKDIRLIKTGTRVIVGRETISQKLAGRAHDNAREVIAGRRDGSKLAAHIIKPAAQKLDRWREATTLESLRARHAINSEQKTIQSAARQEIRQTLASDASQRRASALEQRHDAQAAGRLGDSRMGEGRGGQGATQAQEKRQPELAPWEKQSEERTPAPAPDRDQDRGFER